MQWEYYCQEFNRFSDPSALFTGLGADGWELVDIYTHPGSPMVTAVFKRRKSY